MRITRKLIASLRAENERRLEGWIRDDPKAEDMKCYIQGKIDAYTILLGDSLLMHPKNRQEIWD